MSFIWDKRTMSYEKFIGRRYLMAKKRSQVVSIITVISILGVTLGVMALIVVLSVMGGFKKDLKDKILGTKAHAVIMPAEDDDILDPQAVAERARAVPGVVGAEPFAEGDVMVSSPTNLSGVLLRGIEPERVDEVSDLRADMVEGEIDFLNDPTPLLAQLSEEREARIDDIMERINAERDELDDEKKAEDKPPATPGDIPALKDLDDPPADAPPLDLVADEVGQLDEAARAEPEEEDADEGFMPGIFDADEDDPLTFDDDEPGEESQSDMPPLFDDLSGEGDNQRAERPRNASQSGREDELPGLLIGPELAKSLQVELGSEINVVSPDGAMGPTGPMPKSRPFRIVGIFKTGMYEFDANYAYTSFDSALDFLGKEGASGIEIKTVSSDKAVAIAQDIQAQLGDNVEVLDWEEMNKSLFLALELEKYAMFVVLLFIILVASFSIVAMLIMIVIEKGRDIAILKAMGVPNRSIQRIFTYQGVVIGAVGTAVGLVLGLAVCLYLKYFGVPLNSEVYYISQLPVELNPYEVLAVIASTMLISWLATIYPAYLASQLKPLDGLRDD